MPWNHQTKTLQITGTTDHPCATPGVIGRAPSITGLQFTPSEFFGATARCSHMHFVDPALVTPESLMIASIVKRHVDDISADFAILASANNFKDYIKSFFSGTVAAGLSYLTMIQDGYHWSDHFENVVGPGFGGRTPDFVFAGQSAGIALTEAKGTRSAGKTTFDSTVEAGYLGQVEPHIGSNFGGLFATHGYCIGSWLTSNTKAELLIHHTEVPVSAGVSGAGGQSLAQVQQQNYATVFTLVSGPTFGMQLRKGNVEEVPPLVRFEWLGHRWLIAWHLRLSPDWLIHLLHDIDWPRPVIMGENMPPFLGFAIEEQTAATLLRYFGTDEPRPHADTGIGITPLPPALIEEARQSYDREASAIFPDGLAVIGWRKRMKHPTVVKWDRDGEQFLPA